jgi:predicted alpha/beta-hydrolase family hydrolase
MSGRMLWRFAVALAAVALVAVALLRLESAGEGVAVTRHAIGRIPVTAFAPLPAAGAPRPVVVVAHGFAGSQQLMQPFALTLARRGWLVLTFDFPGHGRNPVPMAGGLVDFAASTRALLDALGEVAVAARTWPGGDGRVVLLGHSMASDIVIRRAMADPSVVATVALSAYSPVVTAAAPRNLLVVDGALEPRMLHEEGLRIAGLALGGARAVEGRTYGEFAAGSARRFALADGVEHISVLYSREAQLEALDWFERALGTPPPQSGRRYVDARGGWLALLYLGLVALAWPLAALLPRAMRTAPDAVVARRAAGAAAAARSTRGSSRREPAPAPPPAPAGAAAMRADDVAAGLVGREHDERLDLPSMSALDEAAPRSAQAALATNPWGGEAARGQGAPPARAARGTGTARGPLGWRGFWPVAVLPAILTPLLLWRVPGGFLPILLGDYLLLHFALYGLLTAAGLWFAGARRPPLAGVRPLALALAALAATLYAVFAIGLPLDRYVTSFAPVGTRALLLVAVLCGALPYFLADEWLVRGASRARGAYAFTKLMFLLSLSLAIALNPERLFFLAIVVPAILVAFVIYGLFSRWTFHSIGHPWAGAFANAVAFAWLIAVTFPVVSP